MKREYVGSGPLAELAAHLDGLRRLQTEEEAAYWKEERERFEESMAFLEEIMNAADILVRAHLIAGGFRNHKGEWRRRRRESA